jgi:hypothetical protein
LKVLILAFKEVEGFCFFSWRFKVEGSCFCS